MSTQPIPILFTIPNFITAGSGRVMFNILTRLDRLRYAPTVCVSRKGGSIENELSNLGVEVLELPFTVPIRPYHKLLQRASTAAQSFKPFGFKIWHSFHYSDDYSEPIIARLSGARYWVYTKKAMSWGSRAWKIRSYLASRIVADNNEMPARFFNLPGLTPKVRVIHHGLPLETFSPAAPIDLHLRDQYHIPPHIPIITCVAQLVPVKDHPTLLHATAKVAGIHLFIAGSTADQSYRDFLDNMTRELSISNRAHYLGNVKDVPALLAESDIFILPSSGRGEGCPVALLEAMACGKACVTTDIPGSRDLIVTGESGILIPPSDPEALAGAIQTLIDSPELRQLYGQNARKRVEELFSIEHEVQAHEAMYSELLGWHD